MAGQQQQQNTDNSLAMLWGLVLIFASIVIFWFFYSYWIAKVILKIRWYEARVIAFFLPRAQDLVTALQTLDPAQAQFIDLVSISSAVGGYLRIPIVILLSIFSFVIYISRPTLRFKNQYSMQSLVAMEQANWFQIAPVVNLDLVNTDITQAPWAMALTPMQFAQQNNLLKLEKIVPTVSKVATVIGNPPIQAKLKGEEAHHVFSMQLGEIWQGIDALSMTTKAMFAICAARAAHDREVADQLVHQIAHSAKRIYAHHSENNVHALDFSGAQALANRYQDHPLIIKHINKHAYVLSVMASMLVLARESGVFASADFLWLKPCDRVLWFMLNCVGRRTAYVEVAGPFAHWIAECTLGHKLQMPMVDTAVDGLEEALKEVALKEVTSTNEENDILSSQ